MADNVQLQFNHLTMDCSCRRH